MFRLVFGLNLNVIGITWNDIDIELCSVHVDISNDKGTWYNKHMHVLLFKSSKYKKSRIIFFLFVKITQMQGISCSTIFLLSSSYPLLIHIHYFIYRNNYVMIQLNGKIFSPVNNFLNMSNRFTWIINLSYNLVFLFETIKSISALW